MTDQNDAPRQQKRKKSAWPLIFGLPLIAVVAAAAIFFTSGGQESETSGQAGQPEDPGSEQAAPSADPEREQAEQAEPSGGLENPALGDEDAPVVMLEFSDYQ